LPPPPPPPTQAGRRSDDARHQRAILMGRRSLLLEQPPPPTGRTRPTRAKPRALPSGANGSEWAANRGRTCANTRLREPEICHGGAGEEVIPFGWLGSPLGATGGGGWAGITWRRAGRVQSAQAEAEAEPRRDSAGRPANWSVHKQVA